MRSQLTALVCLSIIVGLLLSGLTWQPLGVLAGVSIFILSIGLTAIAVIFLPKFWRRGPTRSQWLGLGLIVLLASGYGAWRFPSPSANDISHLLDVSDSESQTIVAIGTLTDGGRFNAGGNQQFWLSVEQVQRPPEHHFRSTQGKVYLTLAPSKIPWRRCQKIRVTGQLYRPMVAKNPGSFNFADYLTKQGIFAGISGKKGVLLEEKFCGLTPIRDRIVQAQIAWLPRDGKGQWPGLLLSSIVLGQKAVNLPVELRNLFNQVGLSHFLAASGYQVSLLVGTVLAFGQRFSKPVAIALGAGTLLFYLGLTGLEPSVIRASLMWGAVMLAIINDRKINTVGALLLVATVMLLVKPVWIWSLGFQLSFLATFGIVVMAKPLQEGLDFLPPKLAEMIAVPVAASVWTTPILLLQLGYLIPAALPLNILITPLLEILSFGGMVSAGLSLIVPTLGSAVAWGLAFPAQWLITIAQQFQGIPNIAVGQVGVWQVGVMYGAFGLIGWVPLGRKRAIWIVLFLIGLLSFPLLFAWQTRVQATVFDSRDGPVIVTQRPGHTTAIAATTVERTDRLLKPFFAKQGINQLDCQVFVEIGRTQAEKIKNCPELTWYSHSPPILAMEFAGQRWWIFWLIPERQQPPPRLNLDQRPDVVIWPGSFFPYAWLEQLRPLQAIAIAPHGNAKLRQKIERYQGQLWVTGEAGAVQWTPRWGLSPALESLDPDLR
ncbi:MAG: ComEC/Rec2 family competence protein [Synechocystis sp.]|nr:ComEC/Rec2 family competence protein [Synechocystis sp.]